VALSEAVTNAIIHGNKQETEKEVAVLFESKHKGLFFTVLDEGQGFDFNNYPDPTDLSVENPEEIGHGLYLMKSLTDVIDYDLETGAVELGFKISSINKELAVSRMKSLQSYFQTAEKTVKA
jgi:serine/threonine-protein kinase RsbW